MFTHHAYEALGSISCARKKRGKKRNKGLSYQDGFQVIMLSNKEATSRKVYPQEVVLMAVGQGSLLLPLCVSVSLPLPLSLSVSFSLKEGRVVAKGNYQVR